MSHILILDIGKTNKKAFVFDEGYRIVFEKSDTLSETVDDEGFPCENIDLLQQWVLETAADLRSDARFQIKAANCSAYGASFVHLDADFQPITPLYNYLKPFPTDLQDWFLGQYGPVEQLSLETASPFLGHLNSGLQLLWLKHHQPFLFHKIKYSLHLPQWIGRLLIKNISPATPPELLTEMTSIGCHTMLWDFQKKGYHYWVKMEGLDRLFPPLHSTNPTQPTTIGLHDSSAALIPYLATFKEPFVLLSTGTWCISMNPFNDEPLTTEELRQDCLSYLTHEGSPVKAARFFGGNAHEIGVRKLASAFGVGEDFFRNGALAKQPLLMTAYHDLMERLVAQQIASTKLAIGKTKVKMIFVDGGFSKNEIFMTLLAKAFKGYEVYAAQVAQATALGAALSVHETWNRNPIPGKLIHLRKFEP